MALAEGAKGGSAAAPAKKKKQRQPKPQATAPSPKPRRSVEAAGSSSRATKPRSLGAYPHIQVNQGINWRKVDPKLITKLNRLAREHGKTINITSGFRTLAEQTRLYNDPNISIVAPPGSSQHEFGNAVDALVDGRPIGDVFTPEQLASVGLHSLAAIGDAVHVERGKSNYSATPVRGRPVASRSTVTTAPIRGERNPAPDLSPGFTPGFPQQDFKPPQSIFDPGEPEMGFYEGGFGSQIEPYGGGIRQIIQDFLLNNFKPDYQFSDSSIPEGVVFPVTTQEETEQVQGGKFIEKRNGRLRAAKNFTLDKKALRVMRQVWDVVGPRYFPGNDMPVPVFLHRRDATVEGAAWVVPGKSGYRLVHWPRDLSRQLVKGKGVNVDTLLHEWAHVFQGSFRRPDFLVEGGAESFAATVYPMVANELGFKKIPFGDFGKYPQWAKKVARKRGRDFVLWEQFGGYRAPHDADLSASDRRVQMWQELAALPGASPETQTYARLVAQAAGPQPRQPNEHSLREWEKRVLGSS